MFLNSVVAEPASKQAQPIEPIRVSPRVVEGHAQWGLLAPLSISSGLALIVIAIGDNLSRSGVRWSEDLFWLGLLAMYVPVVVRLSAFSCSRRERIGLVAILGIGLYMVKVLHSPLYFSQHDELLHIRTAQDILRSHHLFHKNPLLPVSPLYPGMENITTALLSIGGLSLFSAGLLVIGVARLLTVLALYLVIEDISGSERRAGLAVAIYMANPNFLFFDAMFKYESVALSFGMVALYLLVHRRYVDVGTKRGLGVAAIVIMGALVITHHLTSYLFMLLLIVWAIAAWFQRRREPGWLELAGIAALAIVLNAAWFGVVAQATFGYLAPVIARAFFAIWTLIVHEVTGSPGGASRGLFTSTTGYTAPIWERVTAIGGVGLLLIAVSLGVVHIWWGRKWMPAIAFTLAAISLAYPVTLVFRLTGAGWETANRSSEFIFLAVGFVGATAVADFWLRSRLGWRMASAIGLSAGIILCSGIIAGWTPQWRMPGPYSPMLADARGMNPQSFAATDWARIHLDPDSVFGSDDFDSLLLGSYGRAHISTNVAGGQNMNYVLFAPRLGAPQLVSLRRAHVRYFLIDRSLEHLKNAAADYDPGVLMRVVLSKFDSSPRVDRIYDSGRIQIYDVSRLSGAS